MRIVGLVEIQAHDAQGNLLAVSRGHNIVFDNARVAVLLNPCIVDNPSDFVMYFSEFKERLIETYYYWDSSLLTHYLTSTITMTSEDLTPYTKMYQFVSQAVLPGSTARTLRVVGLRSVSLGIYASAVTMDIPVSHGTSTYITGYYKFILGFGEESNLYDNVYNWINRTWSIIGSYNYKKGFYVTSNSSFDQISRATVASLAIRTQSVYNTIQINTGLNAPVLFGAKEKDGNTSVALLINGITGDGPGSGPSTRSRTFLHSSTSNSLYADLTDTVPTSEGSIRINNIDEFVYNTAECVNITKSGGVGTSEYNVTVLPIAHQLSSRGTPTTRRQVNFFYDSSTGYTTYVSYVYFSESRQWGVFFNTLSNLTYIWYKGLRISYTTGSPVWYPGAITNDGVFFYVKLASPNVLKRYDFERIYESGYIEESQTIDSPKLRAYQIDETDSKVVVISYNDVPTIVTNGTFPVDVSGWSIDNAAYVYTSWLSGTMKINVNYYSSAHIYGVWQDLTTVIGRRYYLSLQAVDASSTSYGCYIQINGSNVLSINSLNTFTYTWVATTTTTRLKILPNYQIGYWWTFDNISVTYTEDTNGTIVKVDTNDITSYITYNRTHSNFSGLSVDSMIFATASDRWYWRAGNGKMVWLGSYTAAKRLHYWDGRNIVSTFDETISGTIYDICVTEDFKKICYVVQNTSTLTLCTWVIRSLEDGTRWNLLHSVTRTIPVSSSYYSTTYPGCFVEGNYMYQLSSVSNWGYRTDLITYVGISYHIYTGNTDLESNIRPATLPNRSVIYGALMYNFSSFGYLQSSVPNYSWFFLDMTPFTFGWDGSDWVLDHTGTKVTHREFEDLPMYGSIAFGKETPDDPPSENYVIGEYFTFSVNPNGYVFDNSMTYTSYPAVYTGQPQYVLGESVLLMYPDPLVPSNITYTLSKVEHPDWLCVETNNIEVIFDTGIKGWNVGSTSYLSYFGEYSIDAVTGVIIFHKDCNMHTITINYYWVRRDV